MKLGSLLVRGLVGPLFVGHGTQKLFGWFGGHGREGTSGFFESIGCVQAAATPRPRASPRPRRAPC